LLSEVTKVLKKRKAKKNVNLLSFGAEEEEDMSLVTEKKIKSSHDVLRNDKRLLAEAVIT